MASMLYLRWMQQRYHGEVTNKEDVENGFFSLGFIIVGAHSRPTSFVVVKNDLAVDHTVDMFLPILTSFRAGEVLLPHHWARSLKN